MNCDVYFFRCMMCAVRPSSSSFISLLEKCLPGVRSMNAKKTRARPCPMWGKEIGEKCLERKRCGGFLGCLPLCNLPKRRGKRLCVSMHIRP